jgi:ribosomal protein L29
MEYKKLMKLIKEYVTLKNKGAVGLTINKNDIKKIRQYLKEVC